MTLSHAIGIIQNAIPKTQDLAATMADLAFFFQKELDGGTLDASEILHAIKTECKKLGFEGDSIAREWTNSIKAVRVARNGSEWPTEIDLDKQLGFTEEAMLDRIADKLAADFRFVPEWCKWIAWDTRKWDAENGDALLQSAILETVAKCKANEANGATADTPKEYARRIKYFERYQSFAGLKALFAMAERDMRFRTASNVFDSHQWLLNCANGTLNLLTNELQPFNRGDYLTQQLAINYNREAECEQWKRFLEQVIPEPDVRNYLQRACGYTLTGLTREQCLFILHGGGSNGKSTFIEAIEHILKPYHVKAGMNTFALRDTDNTSDLARMRCARFVTVSENDDNARLSEGLIKTATGDREITARLLYQNPFTYSPAFKVWMSVNHRPIIRGQDDGIWRRINLVAFGVKIEDDQKDKDLGEKLRHEAEGILAWMVRGCNDWRVNGLHPPASVAEGVKNYRAEMDTLGRWIEERCELDDSFSQGATELYANFSEWAKTTGEFAVSLTAFGRRLGDRGFTVGREPGTGKKVRVGIQLAKTPIL